jgi:hypothetical protein
LALSWRERLVNREPWSVLKLFGVPCRAIASSTASRQKLTSVSAEIRHARTRRLNGGDRLARQALTAQGLEPIDRGLRCRLAQLVGAGTAVLQAGQAFGVEAINPFPHRARANTRGFTGGLRRLPAEDHTSASSVRAGWTIY